MRQEHREHRQRPGGDMSPAPRIGRRTALTALGFTMLLPGSIIAQEFSSEDSDDKDKGLPKLPDNRIKVSSQTFEFRESEQEGIYFTDEVIVSVWTNPSPWALVCWLDDGPGIGNGSHSLPPMSISIEFIGPDIKESIRFEDYRKIVPLFPSDRALDGKEILVFRLKAELDPLTSPEDYMGRVVFNVLDDIPSLLKSDDKKKPPEVDVKYKCPVKSFARITVEGELKFGSVLPGEHLCPELATVALSTNLDAVKVSGSLSSMKNGDYSIPLERITIAYGYTENEARSNLVAAYYGIQGFDATLTKQAPRLYIAAKADIRMADPTGLYTGLLRVSTSVGQ